MVEMEKRTLYISNDFFNEIVGVYIPENYTVKFVYTYDGDTIISFDLIIRELLILCTSNKNMVLYLKSVDIKDLLAKKVFEIFGDDDFSCFYSIIEDEVCISIKSNLLKILDFLKDYRYRYCFTLYEYDFKIKGFESYDDIKEYVNSTDYSISYTFEMGLDCFSMAYNETILTEETIEKNLKKICDDYGLFLYYE